MEAIALIIVILVAFLFVDTVFKTIKAWLKFAIVVGLAILAYRYGLPHIW